MYNHLPFVADHLLLFMFRFCHVFLSVQSSLVVAYWERANLLTLLCGVLLCFVTLPCGVLGRVWYLIVSIPYLCLLTYFALVVLWAGLQSVVVWLCGCGIFW